MNLFTMVRDDIKAAIAVLQGDGSLPNDLDLAKVTAEPPRDPSHGDVATNAAMVLGKQAGVAPVLLARLLVERMRRLPAVRDAEVAGPGFLNLRLSDSFWGERLRDLLRAGTAYGDSEAGKGVRVNVEYVSANPTGPMHVGHGRGAVVGDALASLLIKAGFTVCREYYVNDAGAQVDQLARSVHLRYRQALGETDLAIPEGLYPGDYLVEVGRAIADRDGDRWVEPDDQVWLPTFRSEAVAAMLALIRQDLAALGVRHDIFTSERALVESGGVEAAIESLAQKGLIYRGQLEPPKGKPPEDWEPRPQLLFRATRFGDDVDRPLQKSDGSWTYFATDIAYHFDKFRRGYAQMINIWGADHGGYIKRLKAAVTAVTDGAGTLDVQICQMVNLLKDGEPFKMSKRAGTFVTLRDLIDEVGQPVVRFLMLTRKNDAPLDFDLARALEQSRDNPVFYVQYAHARAFSVLRHAATLFPSADLSSHALALASLSLLTDPAELALIKRMAGWPRLIETAAIAHEPHRVAFYLYDVAASFHGLWNKGKDDTSLRFLLPDDAPRSMARLALVRGVALLLASGLAVFGVEPMEEMR
jgi:arginyl-tRNA synthetase